jgi:hypothetical protein
MPAKIINGKEIASAMRGQISGQIEEIKKKYISIGINDKIDTNKQHYLISKLNTFKKTNTPWFTATIPGAGNNKLVIYFNYFTCDCWTIFKIVCCCSWVYKCLTDCYSRWIATYESNCRWCIYYNDRF